MRRDLPAGTVTFFFTDVEGSTKLLHELGAEPYAQALAEHRRIVREACSDHGGVEVDTQGDAFFVAFPTAPAALGAAGAITESLQPGPIRVRMGLHTGTPLVIEEGYVGADVHRAARIAAAGSGGQVLVSASTAALVGADGLEDLGEHRFKDLGAAERVFQLGTAEFPPIRSLYRTNLPVPATPFIGRERELGEVVALLERDDVRLLTLTGPGGSGKTRLALQAAAEVSDRYPDGVWWVALAAVRDASLVLSSIAQTLGVKERPGALLAEVVAGALAGKRLLLLVDNIEHLLPGASSQLAVLLAPPALSIVVTSRERLQLQGEQVYPVPTLEESDAIALFAARARALEPSFDASEAVGELCLRLDCLPLAVELAAARTVVFSPEQLLARLSQRLDLLRGGRDVDPRQQTLRTTIEWSYDLLDPEEQRLFRSLSIFVGGCTYDAAERVCGADPETLQSLLDKSLARRRDSELGPRYWMLETIREFAREMLADDEQTELRDAHLANFADEIRTLGWAARHRDPEALAFLRLEQPNVLAALTHALERRAVEAAQQIVVGAWFHWITGGLAAEAEAWTAQVAALPSEATLLYSQSLALAGEFPRFRGAPERALLSKTRALEVLRQLDSLDPEVQRWTAAIETDLSGIYGQLGDLERAEEYAQRALENRRALGSAWEIAHTLRGVATVAELRGAYDEAATAYAEAVELLDAAGERSEAAGCLSGLGDTLRRLGDLSGARAALEDAMQRALDSGDKFDIADARLKLGLLAGSEGSVELAAELLARGQAEMRELGIALDNAIEIDAVLESCRAELGDSTYFAAVDLINPALRE